MNKSLLTKVSKGIAFGDVSNAAIRNILTEISKRCYGGITEQELRDTVDYFDWKCPYTGEDLIQAIASGEYDTDHIVPQNKEWCGLNIKGNLVVVAKNVNSKKDDKTVEEFLNGKDFQNLDPAEKQNRLNKIKQFQKDCGYDPNKIRNVLRPLLSGHYQDVREAQKNTVNKMINQLGGIGIKELVPVQANRPSGRGSSGKNTPRIAFYISNVAVSKDVFKAELIKKKEACFSLTYDSGKVVSTKWNAKKRFDDNSDLISNVQSRPFWRKWKTEGLLKVDVLID